MYKKMPQKSILAGLILLNKPSGITSFKSLSYIKNRVSGKVGHTGTLDKFASGLLIALVGRCTKLNLLFSNMDKIYKSVFKFGEETDTLDSTGKIIRNSASPEKDCILKNLSKFIGEIDQKPPKYSAVHIKGKRAYQIARKGEEFEIPSRKVKIEKFSLLNWTENRAEFIIKCTKGTYIRSLARDLGRECGSAASVEKLVRINIGPYRIEDSVLPDKFNPENDIILPETFIDDIPEIKKIVVTEDDEKRISHGTPPEIFLKNRITEIGLHAAFNEDNDFLAIINNSSDGIHYLFVGCPAKKL